MLKYSQSTPYIPQSWGTFEAGGHHQTPGRKYPAPSFQRSQRIWEQKNKAIERFTKKYNVDKLVYFEQYHDPKNAIKREKGLKRYNRRWKLELIEKENPEWRDLYTDLVSGLPDQVG